jgi:glycosyltransferase involved in cell wall biosynthesis
MDNSWHVAVLIPARDEEKLLPRCLRSVLIAVGRLPDRVRSNIVVVSDSSTDRTGQVAIALLGSHGCVVSVQVRNVGSARRLAADYALGHRQGPLKRAWLANTDADCIVPSSWLCDQLKLADEGIEAIAGAVSVDSFEEHDLKVAERFRTSYTIGTDGTHPHIHGANLGVRADAYLRAGGWSDLVTAEDHDLWGRLHRESTRMASPASVQVTTSGRRIGRAPQGFAGALAAHNKAEISA